MNVTADTIKITLLSQTDWRLKCFNYSTNVDNSSRMKRGQDWSEKQFKFTDMVKNGDFAYKA